MTGPRLFCFGLGYSAKVLARRLLAEGWSVAGTTRAEDGLAGLGEIGVEAHLFARGRPLDPAALKGATHLLASVPPDDQGDPVLAEHGADIAKLDLSWAGYLSTTGVYGDWRGAWVDESEPLRPSLERSWRRVAAETGWQDLLRAHATPIHLFRLAGIYGPGRSAVDSVRTGRAQRVIKRGQIFCRIHVEDIATVLRASMDRPNPGAIYNVSDDLPCPPQDPITHACELLGVEPPPEIPFEEARLNPMQASFFHDSKRVRNDRIKRELGVTLRYPTYREGLRAIVDASPPSPG
ncbi:MAG: SDR family oxidoreductase [Alphaproteobacteria bacterium]|nr:SDR family oxidoreductase [Alphaproteobacteria bacterium]